MNNSYKKAGYDHEEFYFHELNKKLIQQQKEKDQSGKLLPFTPKLTNQESQNTKKKAA